MISNADYDAGIVRSIPLIFQRKAALVTVNSSPSIRAMPPKHLDQVVVEDPKLAEGLTAFGEFLRTSYFYPSGSYEKCEDSRAPDAWATISKKFDPFIKVSPMLLILPPTLFRDQLYKTPSSD